MMPKPQTKPVIKYLRLEDQLEKKHDASKKNIESRLEKEERWRSHAGLKRGEMKNGT
jgi:hypothetical protein